MGIWNGEWPTFGKLGSLWWKAEHSAKYWCNTAMIKRRVTGGSVVVAEANLRINDPRSVSPAHQFHLLLGKLPLNTKLQYAHYSREIIIGSWATFHVYCQNARIVVIAEFYLYRLYLQLKLGFVLHLILQGQFLLQTIH